MIEEYFKEMESCIKRNHKKLEKLFYEATHDECILPLLDTLIPSICKLVSDAANTESQKESMKKHLITLINESFAYYKESKAEKKGKK